jgi:hypothetical protein
MLLRDCLNTSAVSCRERNFQLQVVSAGRYANISEQQWHEKWKVLFIGGAVLAPMCICSHYLNVIFDTFWNIKKIQMKNSHVHLYMLCVRKVVLRKTILSFGLRKKKNFDAKKKTLYHTCFVFFTPTTCNVIFSQNFYKRIWIMKMYMWNFSFEFFDTPKYNFLA